MKGLFQIVSFDEIDNYSQVIYGGSFNECVEWMKHNAEGFNKQNYTKKCKSKNTEKELFYMEEFTEDIQEQHLAEWY